MRRLPPLNPLRAFEAAARHEGFNRAADELHVTASAISHQVRTLEEYLGVTLFRRHPRAVSLTDAGREFLPPVRESLDRIGVAAERLVRDCDDQVLTISVAPAFALGWLMPKLVDLQLARPELQVRIDTSIRLVDFATSDVDAAIRHTQTAAAPGLCTHRLFREELVVVCSPELASTLSHPADLAQVTLLQSEHHMGRWRTWLAAAGVTEADPERGPRLDNDTLALEAAARGLGAAIVQLQVAQQAIGEQRLAMPFDVGYTGPHGYFLVYPENAAERPKIAAFREWLLATLDCGAGISG